MIRGKKVLALALSVALTATMFVGCGAKKDSKKTDSKKDTNTIKVWSPATDQDFIKEQSDKFLAAHPDLKVKIEVATMGENDARDGVEKDPLTAADVFAFASDQLAPLVRGGYLAKLSGLESEGCVYEGQYTEQALNACKYENEIYALPFTNNAIILYYDNTLLTPEEVKSFETIVSKQHANGAINIAFDVSKGFYINGFFSGAGCQLYGADGKDDNTVTWNSPEGVEVVTKLRDLAADPAKFLCPDDSQFTKFKEGKLAAYISGAWDATSVKENLGERYAATILPTMKLSSGDKQIKPFAGFKLYGVNEKTKNREAAIRLAYYLNSKEVQQARYEKLGYAPTHVELLTQEFKDAATKATIEQVDGQNSTLEPKAKNFSLFWAPSDALGDQIKNNDAKLATPEGIKTVLDDTCKAMTNTAAAK